MSHFSRFRNIVLVLLLSPVGAAAESPLSWFAGSDVEDLRNDVNIQLKELRGLVDRHMETALRAIPGSDWTEARFWLYQDCNTYPNEKKEHCEKQKKRYQAYLDNVRNATGTSPDIPYQVSVTVDSEGVDLKNIQIDVIQAYFASMVDPGNRSYVQQQLNRFGFESYPLVEGAFMQRPITNDEVSQAIDAAATSLFESMYSWKPPVRGQAYSFGSIEHLNVSSEAFQKAARSCPFNGAQFDYINQYQCAYGKLRLEFVSNLTAAITAPYLNVTDTRTVGRFSKVWDSLATGQHLVVLIRQEDAKALFNAGSSLTFSIHEKDRPTAQHPRGRVLPLVREDFHWDEPVDAPQRAPKLVFALKYALYGEPLDLSIYDAIAEQRKTLLQTASVIKAKPAEQPEGRSWWKFW